MCLLKYKRIKFTATTNLITNNDTLYYHPDPGCINLEFSGQSLSICLVRREFIIE